MAIEVAVDHGKHGWEVEILVSAEHKHDFVAKELGPTPEAAMDACVHKIEQQLRRYKEKVQHHKGDVTHGGPSPRSSRVARLRSRPKPIPTRSNLAPALNRSPRQSPRPMHCRAGYLSAGRSGVDGLPARRRLDAGPGSVGSVGPSLEGRMKLLDFVVRESVIVDLQATGKEEAIREMVGSLHRAGKLANDDLESVIRAILGREELGSTGIGQGVAVPHTRHPTLHRLIGTVALSRRGVDFAALDGEPVDIFFLLVSPQNQPGDHSEGPGEYFAAPERRAIRGFLAPGPDARERDRGSGGGRSGLFVTMRAADRAAAGSRTARATKHRGAQALVWRWSRESEPLIKQRFVTAGCGVTAHASSLSSSPWIARATMSTRSLRRTKTQTDEDRRAVVPVR